MASPRKTLDALSLTASKARGQNFLSDPNLIKKLAGLITSRLQPGQSILEIGPGLGALTKPILADGAPVIAVEYDRGLAKYLTNNPDFPGLKVLPQDILTVDLDIIAQEAGGPLLVAGNLPYNLTSPILFWLLNFRKSATGAIFMMQKEVATRLCAAPGNKDYGRLSIALSLGAEIKPLMDVPPGAFHPRPKVDSQVVGLTLKKSDDIDFQVLGKFTQQAFLARRKTILNNLSPTFGKNQTLAALKTLSIDPTQRPETISPEHFAQLSKILVINSDNI